MKRAPEHVGITGVGNPVVLKHKRFEADTKLLKGQTATRNLAHRPFSTVRKTQQNSRSE